MLPTEAGQAAIQVIAQANDAWQWGWIAIGSLATATLAAGTYLLARQTKSALIADRRPILTVSELEVRPDRSTGRGLELTATTIRVPILNCGRGPALATQVVFDTEHPSAFPAATSAPIPVDHYSWFEWNTGPKAAFPRVMAGRVRYTDIAGVRYETEFEITHHTFRPSGAGVRWQAVRRRRRGTDGARRVFHRLRAPRRTPAY